MGALSKFGLTDQEIDAEIARNPEVLKGLEDLAHRVETSLKAKAPIFDAVRDRRDAPPDPEHPFIDSIHTELVRRRDGKPAARVGSDHYLAIPIELGTRHMPEMAIFAQTAAEFGDTHGPIFSHGVELAQTNLHNQVETLNQMKANGASKASIKAQQALVNVALGERSAAFRAARRRRRR